MLAEHRHLLKNSFTSFLLTHKYYIYPIIFYVFKATGRDRTTLTNDTSEDARDVPTPRDLQMLFEGGRTQLDGQQKGKTEITSKC